jgi:predicted transposase YbfD/YdcC
MPATPSSPIEPAIDHLVGLARTVGDAAGASSGSPSGLLLVLEGVADPRKRRGVRHRLAVILGLAVCAVLAGARTFTAIAEWAADADEATMAEFGITRVPCESTLRRTLQNLDADAFDDQVGGWTQERTTPTPGVRRRVAVDGKTLRGSAVGADPDQPGRHLLAALDHAHGVVLGQVDVAAKTNEIPMFTTLLDRIDLSDAVVTADAMHAQRAHAEYLIDQRNAHYLLTVKGNQPHLHAQLAALPWREIPVADEVSERGHGRQERRTLKVTAVTEQAGGLNFPHAAQAIQVVRHRRPLTGKGKHAKKGSTETVYAITSLGATQTSPADLADIIRGHWSIEDRLHWVRDVVYDEDRSQVRTRNGPRVMASLRNLAISILRLTGTTNIAARLRHNARRPHRPLHVIMRC